MATGFVDRIKGKVTHDPNTLWIAGTPQYGTVSAQTMSLSSAASTSDPGAAPLVNAYGTSVINCSSGPNIVRLAPPTFPGQSKTIQLNFVVPGSSLVGALWTKASTDGSIMYNGSSFSVVKSTVGPSVIQLIATSVTNWAVSGLFNSSATHTFSTST